MRLRKCNIEDLRSHQEIVIATDNLSPDWLRRMNANIGIQQENGIFTYQIYVHWTEGTIPREGRRWWNNFLR